MVKTVIGVRGKDPLTPFVFLKQW